MPRKAVECVRCGGRSRGKRALCRECRELGRADFDLWPGELGCEPERSELGALLVSLADPSFGHHWSDGEWDWDADGQAGLVRQGMRRR